MAPVSFGGNRKQKLLAVIGAGHVGLPIAARLAMSGYAVVAVDSDGRRVDLINSGIDPLAEPKLQQLIEINVTSGRLKCVRQLQEVQSDPDTFIVSVPTPVRGKTSDLSSLLEAVEAVALRLRRRGTVIILSTVPPGSIKGVVKATLERGSGLKAERDFSLAYIPERIAPPHALTDIPELPTLVGGIGPKSTMRAVQVFKKICKKLVPVDVAVAEVAKLAENSFRDVNIAFANELALLCERLSADSKKVIAAANTHPRVKILDPGPGVGGACLPKDPWLLISPKAGRLESGVIAAARLRNDSMSDHILNLCMKAIRQSGKAGRVCTFAVLGTAYKAGVSDSRLSPSERFIRQLVRRGHNVRTYDPYSEETFGAQRALTLIEAVNRADCIVIMVDHPENREIDLARCKTVMREKPALVDGKRIVDPSKAKKMGFAYYGLGYSEVPRVPK